MKTIALAVIAATAGLTHAAQYVIDVSGTQFWDEQGASINETLSVFLGPQAHITGFSWDVNLTTLTAPGLDFPSWASEATILLDGAYSIAFGHADPFGVVNENYSGSIDLDHYIGADGYIDIEFYESFDDASGEVDAFFGAGSTITIEGCAFLPDCPTPGSLAAFGTVGLITTRRRR